MRTWGCSPTPKPPTTKRRQTAAELICGVAAAHLVLTHGKCAAVQYSRRLAAEIPRRFDLGGNGQSYLSVSDFYPHPASDH
jgi:hypothetical protein